VAERLLQLNELETEAITAYVAALVRLKTDAEAEVVRLRYRLEDLQMVICVLADDVSDGAFHIQPFDNERLADRLREVARD
jgi:hypothetical protein